MATTIAKLNIHLGAQTSALESGLRRAAGAVDSFAGLAMRALGGLSAVVAGGEGITWPLRLAADAEQAEVAFGTLLGSAQAAQEVIGEINQFAAETPFETPELRDAGRMLAAFGTDAQEIVPTLRMIGDVAAGTNQPIGELAEIFGKAKVQGRLFMEDINQLTGRGIPIIGELARQFGVVESEVRELVSSGQVNFENLEEAFRSMTSEGGKFAGLMAAQSETLSGQISTLKDNVALLAAELGQKLLPLAKATTAAAIDLTGQIASLDAGTVRSVAQWAALAGGFALAMSIIPRVVQGVRAVIATVRALTTTSAIAQGVIGGPAGLVKVIAGLAVGVGAAVAVGAAFDRFAEGAEVATQEANAAAAAVAEVTRETAGLADVGAQIGPSFASAKEAETWLKKMSDAAQKVTEEVRTPFEVFEDEMANLNQLLNLPGDASISWETWTRAATKAIDELDEATQKERTLKPPKLEGVGAVTRNTSAGFSAVQQALRAEQRRLQELAEKDRIEQAKHTRLLEQMARAREAITVNRVSL